MERKAKRTATQRKGFVEVIKAAAVVGCLVAVSYGMGSWGQVFIDGFSVRVADMGVWGPVAFMAVNALLIVLFMPQAVFSVAAGALFGWTLGVLWASLGMTIGATGAFFLARYGVRERLSSRFADNAAFMRIQKLSGVYPKSVVALSRLNPAMPFSLTSYALGVSRVRTASFTMLTWLCMLPETMILASGGRLLQVGIGGAGGAMEAFAVLCAAGIWLAVVAYWVKKRLVDVDQLD